MTTLAKNIKISFWELISATVKIEIPIIQRDYAQGRNDDKTKKIRNKFLDDLIKAIECKESDKNFPLELDFVYGDIENNIFQSLDGQQRLTTLFLLHWYIALQTDKLKEHKSQFKKFTYETRISSREFCNEIAENGNALGEGKTVSEKISDSKWFFLSWKKDPTIKAMLIMLDSIEVKLKNITEDNLMVFWNKLTSENAPITFYFTKLNDIGLTDDLYIKMNARGKALSDFENFKARMERHIKEGNQDKKDWEKDLEGNPIDAFSHKIDTLWTDLFWKYRGEDNQVDSKFIKFISGVAINYYAQDLKIYRNEEEDLNIRTKLEEKSNSKSKITDDAVKRERIERRITTLFNNLEDVNTEDFSTKESFEYLKKCFDVYSQKSNNELLPRTPLWEYLENKKVNINDITQLDNNLFIEFIKDGKTEYKQRVLFYAQTQYLLSSNEVNNEAFSEWMRVARNIVQNSTIDSATAFIGAINLINELSAGCENIYEYLSINTIKSTFSSSQINEEILKSSVIADSSNNKEVLFLTEDTKFFKGKIIFALYCVDFESIESTFDAATLDSVYKVVCEYLNSDDISSKFRSALLTVRKNDYYEYWKSWSYGTNTHKRSLVTNTLDLKRNFASGYFRDYLKDLILKLVAKSLDEIINDFSCPQDMPNWKCRLIKEPQLQDKYCQSHYLGIPHDNTCCFLYNDKKRPSCREECEKIE